jgi:hypothetical protein
MNNTFLKSALLVSLLLPVAAVAEEDISVGAQVGIFGIGANAKYKINDQFGVRASFDMFSVNDYEIEDDETNTKYNFDLKLQDIMITGDYHPWKGAFKTSAGLIVNSSALDGEITPATSQEFEFQGHTYSTDDIAKVNAKVDFDPVAPYVGIGWDTSFNKLKGFGFTFDIGVIYQGSAQVDYTVNYKELEKTGNATVDQAAEDIRDELIQNINQDLEKEKVSLQEELDKYELLPYISIGFNYKF